MPNHHARQPYGTATLVARIPTPMQRETARDAVKGAMAVCDAGAAIVMASRKQVAALEAETAKMREALKPFAELAEYLATHCDDASDEDETAVSIKDLRAARAALAQSERAKAEEPAP